jgi:hypothetical protein
MMKQLYGFQGSVGLFAVLRELWPIDDAAQPMLAMLCASARDPLLRCTADFVLDLDVGDETGPAEIGAEVARSFPNRSTPGVLHHIGQNVGASWAQAGLLIGRRTKRRARHVGGRRGRT